MANADGWRPDWPQENHEPLFELSRRGSVLVVTLGRDLVWSIHERFDEVQELVQRVANDPSIRHVVADFSKNRSYSTATLQMLARVWYTVRQRGGKIALCGVSEMGLQTVLRTKLDQVWPVYPDLETAIAAVTAES